MANFRYFLPLPSSIIFRLNALLSYFRSPLPLLFSEPRGLLRKEVIQPHRYSRLQALCDDFADAFANADKLLLIDVFSAGEMPIPGVTSKMLADTVRAKHPGKEVVYCSSRLELNQELEQMVGEGDLLLTMGAGDVTTVGPEFIEYLTAKKDA